MEQKFSIQRQDILFWNKDNSHRQFTCLENWVIKGKSTELSGFYNAYQAKNFIKQFLNE